MLHLVSSNLKTDYSINFPIDKTCHPTSVCMKVCYARRGRLSMDASLARQEAVLEVFNKYDPSDIGEAIGEGYDKHGLSFLRWCGSGDLTFKACEVINYILENFPHQKHWVVTRKPEMARFLQDGNGLYLMFSLDNSKQSEIRRKEADKYNHPRLYYSYLRTSPDDDTSGAKIVFNQQRKNLPYDDPGRLCPVDAGKMKVEGACKQCRKCFS